MKSINESRIQKGITIKEIAKETRLSIPTVRSVLGTDGGGKSSPRVASIAAVTGYISRHEGNGKPLPHRQSDAKLKTALRQILGNGKRPSVVSREFGISISYLSKILHGHRKASLLDAVTKEIQQ